jgi:hypothetical protein
LAPVSSPTNPPTAPDQRNLKVSSKPERLASRYRRVQEATMNSRIPENVVFETLGGCALLAAAAMFAALLYRLITVAAPLLESIARAQVPR